MHIMGGICCVAPKHAVCTSGEIPKIKETASCIGSCLYRSCGIKRRNNVSKKNLRSNPEQIKYLVEYMSTHNMFALGEYTGPLGRWAHNEEWTWRDLKKTARIDGVRHNQAINKTGNNPEHVPPVSSTSRKILSIIGTESAYGIAQSSETGLGEFPADVIEIEDSPTIPSNHIPPGPSISPPPQYSPPGLSMCPPPHISPPSLTTCISLLAPTSLSPLPDSSSITSQIPTQTPNTRRRPPTSFKNDFLASDENTRSVLKEINNNLKYRNVLEEIKMRRNIAERLHKYRQIPETIKLSTREHNLSTVSNRCFR